MSRLGAAVGAGVVGVAGSVAGVLLAERIDGKAMARRSGDDALMGTIGMFLGSVIGAAIGAGSSEPKQIGSLSDPRFP